MPMAGATVSSNSAPSAPRTTQTFILAVNEDGTEHLIQEAKTAKKCKKPKTGKPKKCKKPKPDPAPSPAPEPDPSEWVPKGNPASFAFIGTDAQGRPARWDPCKPIVYAINSAGAPAGGVEVVQQGVQRLAQASGYQFQFAGETEVIPLVSRDWYVGKEDGPIDMYISFATEQQVPDLAGGVAGLAGPVWATGVSDREPEILVAGMVLDSQTDLPMDYRPGGFGAVTIHELGHTMNLAHVDDSEQIMHPTISVDSPNHYQAGDVSGFAAGRNLGCF